MGNEKMPSVISRLWAAWKRVAKKVGEFQARVLLAVFYFVLVWPFALAVRWGSDPLEIKPHTPKGWHPKVERGDPMGRAQRQF